MCVPSFWFPCHLVLPLPSFGLYLTLCDSFWRVFYVVDQYIWKSALAPKHHTIGGALWCCSGESPLPQIMHLRFNKVRSQNLLGTLLLSTGMITTHEDMYSLAFGHCFLPHFKWSFSHDASKMTQGPMTHGNTCVLRRWSLREMHVYHLKVIHLIAHI